MIFSKMIHHNVKVLYCTKLIINTCVSRILAIVTEASVKTHRLSHS